MCRPRNRDQIILEREKRSGGGRKATRENRHAEGLGTRTGSSRMAGMDSGKKERKKRSLVMVNTLLWSLNVWSYRPLKGVPSPPCRDYWSCSYPLRPALVVTTAV